MSYTDAQGVYHVTEAEASDPGFTLPDGVTFFKVDPPGVTAYVPPPFETPVKETTVADFVIGSGFKAQIDAKGWHPAGDEVYFAQTANAKYSMCECVEGLLWYSSASNKVGVVNFL